MKLDITSINLTSASCETTIRKYLLECGNVKINLTKSTLENKDVYNRVDETDKIKLALKHFNILMASLGHSGKTPRLVLTKIVQRCNADMIVESALERVGVQRK